jgi:predicted secreted hydrolase
VSGHRRALLRVIGVVLAAVATLAAAGYPDVTPGANVRLPVDAGAHPEFRTEWWYVTGWLATGSGEPLGFQVTFFRTRPTPDLENPSAFAGRQVLIAHAAVSDPKRGRLWHDQRILREGFGLAAAATGRTDVHLKDWSLAERDGGFAAMVRAEDFGFALTLRPRAPPLLNGTGGYSQKGPAPESASLYYSVPQLAVTGTLERAGRREPVTGAAWLDHEWSSTYLDAEAVGWDWIGLNLDGGGALMAFRIRDARGQPRWAGGTLRQADGTVRILRPEEVSFAPGRRWRSPRTLIEYPVEWQLRAGELALELVPLMDDQESDSRLTTGAVYWEGAVEARSSSRVLGRGYLELTGYGERLRLR